MIASCHIRLAEAAPAISGPAAAATEETRPLTQRLSALWDLEDGSSRIKENHQDVSVGWQLLLPPEGQMDIS